MLTIVSLLLTLWTRVCSNPRISTMCVTSISREWMVFSCRTRRYTKNLFPPLFHSTRSPSNAYMLSNCGSSSWTSCRKDTRFVHHIPILSDVLRGYCAPDNTLILPTVSSLSVRLMRATRWFVRVSICICMCACSISSKANAYWSGALHLEGP